MGRIKRYPRLCVYQNGLFVGHFLKQPDGAVAFRYGEDWLNNPDACPVSLSLPLREDAFRGAAVSAVFENLLPDSESLRRRVAEKVGAQGTDAYSLLHQIGRDCVGALQFIPETDALESQKTSAIHGEAISDEDIERILNNLARAPLGLDRDHDFRISVAGAQEKTALLFHEGRWLRPSGTTPTTHILKTQIGKLQNGLNLSDSVENEFYCLTLMSAFGLPVNKVRIETFGQTKSLVIERFDRMWTQDGHLLRIPQEDCCQALSCPPTQKYQNDGGPNMAKILDLLKASDKPLEDQKLFLKAQMLFWLIGATDGHAKNFSVFLGAGGRFHLTPLYDVLTAQPYYDARQIERKNFKMAMSVGENKHDKIEDIHGRHFKETARKAGVPEYLVQEALDEIANVADNALQTLESKLPPHFPENIHASTSNSLKRRLHSF